MEPDDIGQQSDVPRLIFERTEPHTCPFGQVGDV